MGIDGIVINTSLHPVRNDAPLLCNGVRSQNNSGGVWCPAGISNGVNLEEDE